MSQRRAKGLTDNVPQQQNRKVVDEAHQLVACGGRDDRDVRAHLGQSCHLRPRLVWMRGCDGVCYLHIPRLSATGIFLQEHIVRMQGETFSSLCPDGGIGQSERASVQRLERNTEDEHPGAHAERGVQCNGLVFEMLPWTMPALPRLAASCRSG